MQYDRRLYGKSGRDTKTQERRPCEDRGRDWSDCKPRISGKHQKPGEGHEQILSQSPQEGLLQISRTVRQHISVVFRHPAVGDVIQGVKVNVQRLYVPGDIVPNVQPKSLVTFQGKFYLRSSALPSGLTRHLPYIHPWLRAVGDAEVQRGGGIAGWRGVDWYLEPASGVFLSSQSSLCGAARHPFIA